MVTSSFLNYSTVSQPWFCHWYSWNTEHFHHQVKPHIAILETFTSTCYELKVCVPLKFTYWNLKSPVWWYLEEGPLGGNWVWIRSWGKDIIMELCLYKKMRVTSLFSLLCKNTVRRHLSSNQEEGPHHEPNLLTPWVWTFQLSELWEINFC